MISAIILESSWHHCGSLMKVKFPWVDHQLLGSSMIQGDQVTYNISISPIISNFDHGCVDDCVIGFHCLYLHDSGAPGVVQLKFQTLL